MTSTRLTLIILVVLSSLTAAACSTIEAPVTPDQPLANTASASEPSGALEAADLGAESPEAIEAADLGAESPEAVVAADAGASDGEVMVADGGASDGDVVVADAGASDGEVDAADGAIHATPSPADGELRTCDNVHLDADGEPDKVTYLDNGDDDGTVTVRFEFASGKTLETTTPTDGPYQAPDRADWPCADSLDIDRNGRAEFPVIWGVGPHWTSEILITWEADRLDVIRTSDGEPYEFYWSGGIHQVAAACFDSQTGPLLIERSFPRLPPTDLSEEDLALWELEQEPADARSFKLEGFTMNEQLGWTSTTDPLPGDPDQVPTIDDARFDSPVEVSCWPTPAE